MIETLKPYGAIAECEIRYLCTSPTNSHFFVVDNYANQWEIDENTFKKLSVHGFITKEVVIK